MQQPCQYSLSSLNLILNLNLNNNKLIQVEYILFSNEISHVSAAASTESISSVSNCSPRQLVSVITHDFMENCTTPWVTQLVDSKKPNVKVFILLLICVRRSAQFPRRMHCLHGLFVLRNEQHLYAAGATLPTDQRSAVSQAAHVPASVLPIESVLLVRLWCRRSSSHPWFSASGTASGSVN